MFPQSVPVYPLPDTAFAFKYFQAAGRLTWIAHDASDALSSATGQETVPALGRAPETSSVDPALLQDIRTAPVSSVRECNPTAPVLKSEAFQEEVSDIAQVHCENDPGGGDSHMKQTGMLVVSLRGVNFGLWSRLGCSGQSANILSRQGLV